MIYEAIPAGLNCPHRVIIPYINHRHGLYKKTQHRRAARCHLYMGIYAKFVHICVDAMMYDVFI